MLLEWYSTRIDSILVDDASYATTVLRPRARGYSKGRRGAPHNEVEQACRRDRGFQQKITDIIGLAQDFLSGRITFHRISSGVRLPHWAASS